MDRHIKIGALYSTLTHQFSDIFSARQAIIAYEFKNNTYRATVPNAFFFDATGDLRASRSHERNISKNSALRAQGDLAVQTKVWEDRIGIAALTGYEISRNYDDNYLETGTLTSISLTNPVNGLPPLTPLATSLNTYGKGGAMRSSRMPKRLF